MPTRPSRLGLLLAATLAAGCGHAAMTDAQAGVPDRSAQADSARVRALCDGVEALREFRRGHFAARKPGATPSDRTQRDRLAGAVDRLRREPSGVPAAKFEAAVQALEMGLSAMEQVLAASGRNDADGLDRAWAYFDAAIESLADALK